MRKIDLLPTEENIVSTLKDDLVGRNESLFYFIELLNEVEGGVSISIDGYWGCGKTFFVKQAKYILDVLNPNVADYKIEEVDIVEQLFSRFGSRKEVKDYQPQISVYYDAWKNDNDADPVLSIIYTVIDSIDKKYTLTQPGSMLKFAVRIAEKISGMELLDAFDEFKGENPLDVIRNQHSLEDNIKQFLNEIITERGNRLIIFIDELDRCRPQFAVKLLERIKHYFELENLTFVFSINTAELQHAVKQYYGQGFNASRYLDRFFDFRLSIPPAITDKFYAKIGLENGGWVYEQNCCEVISICKFEFREIMRFYSVAKAAAYDVLHKDKQFLFPDGKATEFNLLYILPVMIGLKLSDISIYEEFISGKNISFFKELVLSQCGVGLYPLTEFIEVDETLAKEGGGKKHVNAEDVIQKWYEAVFLEKYDYRHYSHVMGKVSFEGKHKIELLKAISLLSKYASFDV